MTEDNKQEEYIKTIQEQVMNILSGIKEEMGVDMPIEVEVREVDDSE